LASLETFALETFALDLLDLMDLLDLLPFVFLTGFYSLAILFSLVATAAFFALSATALPLALIYAIFAAVPLSLPLPTESPFLFLESLALFFELALRSYTDLFIAAVLFFC